MPSFMPGPHYGDYIILDIDLDSGLVTNWKKPDAELIEEAINSKPLDLRGCCMTGSMHPHQIESKHGDYFS